MKKSRYYAPVIVSVYDRPHHFKQCIESLKRNEGADKTRLFISSDGPVDTPESKEKVRLVREYIASITGFKKVYSFCPTENTEGRIKITTFENVKSDYPSYIKTEDDNVFSPYALRYFNQGLYYFEDDPKIHAICGYMYPNFPDKNFEQLYLPCLSFWGTGFWRDKDIYPNFNEVKLAKEILADSVLFTKVNRILPHMAPMIKAIIDGKLQAGDVTRCNYIIKHDQMCVFPSVSLVQNIGNDGTGVNCGTDTAFDNQKISEHPVNFNHEKPKEIDPKHIEWLRIYFGGTKAIIRGYLIRQDFITNNAFIKFLIRRSLAVGRYVNNRLQQNNNHV